MRMMGAESVEYHRSTVLGRADDHPGMAMEYYASPRRNPPRVGRVGGGGARPRWSSYAGELRGGLRPGWRKGPPHR